MYEQPTKDRQPSLTSEEREVGKVNEGGGGNSKKIEETKTYRGKKCIYRVSISSEIRDHSVSMNKSWML